MTTQTFRSPSQWNPTSLVIFGAGTILLISTWIIWFGWVSLFTEALLVPWHCCGLEPLPVPGTWQRTVNDFFAVFPETVLPSTLFVLAEFAIVSLRISRAENKVWLPLTFSLANILLLAADLLVTNLSWAVSNAIVGPRIGIDAGFHRTWYGIAAHLALWSIFFFALVRAKLPGQAGE